MRALSNLGALLCFSFHFLSGAAIHASEAGVVDWHKPLIGDALTGNPTLSPVFHRLGEADESTKSYILTATTSNVLAALHPENGTIAWRHVFSEKDRIIAFKKHKDVVATVSGTGGATIRLLDISSGDLLLEQQLHKPEAGRLLEPDNTGVSLAFDSDRANVYALTNGHTVRRILTTTGQLQWGWTSPDQSSLVIYSTLVPTSSAVYVLGLAKSFASYTLHVTALSPSDGSIISTADVPSSITDGPQSVFALRKAGNGTEVVRAVWLEGGSIRSVKLTPELKEKPVPVKGAVYQEIIDAGLNDHGIFVALKDDGSGRVIKINEEGTGLKVIWEFADSAKATHYTASMYTGGFDMDGYPYIGRVFWSHAYKKASAHIFAPHLAEGKGLVTGYTFPFETGVHGIIANVALDTAHPEEYRVIGRLVVITTTGALQLWQYDQLQWSREEGLANIQVAEFVELPEKKVIASGEGEEKETFIDRLWRQLAEAQDFPEYAVNFAKRFVTGSYDSVSGPVAPVSNTTALVRDTFGFRKVLVVATTRGKIYGIDSANGEVVWSRVFGLGWAAEVGARIFPVKIFTTRSVRDGDTPQVVLVTQRRANNGLVDTVLFHIDALTGEDARYASQDNDVLQGFDAIAGPLVEAFLLRDAGAKYVVLFDEFLQAHIYPETPGNLESFSSLIPSLHFALRTGRPGAGRLTGHRLSLDKEFTGKHVAHPSWTQSLPDDEDIQAVITRPYEPVASYGKVLGNRTTLYKYLNPNVVAVLTSSTSTCGVYVMDTAKGTILYHSILPAPGGICDIKTAFTENWLIYHYYDDEVGLDQAKSYRVVSVEFYEGSRIDEKISSSDISSYSNETTSISVFEQSYIFPRGISAIAATSTKFGITSREIIVAGENGVIQAFPRRFLDPRRPKRKPTSEEQEEWLMQYDPIIPDDPKRVLSHTYKVARTQKIITSPALLESTSLVFAYGLDLFSTRTAPSNTFDVLSENFNKAQLVLTVAGLALAIIVTKPMVRRKRLRERWYD